MKLSFLFTAALLAAAPFAHAGNPLIPGKGVADPQISIYNNRAYLYASHDDSTANKTYVMRDWWVWSSDDLVNWKWESTLNPKETFHKRPYTACFATCSATKNNKYYWYYSIGAGLIGVASSDSPAGPWKEARGKPLVSPGMTPIAAHDPEVLVDDDGSAYMVFGYKSYYMVKLNEDMISLAEKPRLVVVDRPWSEYGPGRVSDKPGLFKRNGLYYLTWGGFYAVSKNVYGPYTLRGSIVSYPGMELSKEVFERQTEPAFRANHDKHPLNFDRHGSHFTWNNQWYYTCNDKSSPGATSWFRDAIIAYVHYRDNGDMAPIRIDAIGVGQYDAAQAKIEAEDYFASEKIEVREIPGDGSGCCFEVRGVTDKSRLVYPKVKNLPENATLELCVSSLPGGATIEVSEDRADGPTLGTVTIPATGGWDKYQTVSCPLKNTAGTKNLRFTFKGGDKELVRIDWWRVRR